MAQNQDDEIRYTKSVMQVWDPRQANFQEAGKLIAIIIIYSPQYISIILSYLSFSQLS